MRGADNDLNSTNGTALNLNAVTIGAAGLTFKSISAGGGPSNGINLVNTGMAGGLTVTGTGTAGSGGVITDKTGADGSITSGIGIYLESTRGIALNWMQLSNHENFAVRGFDVVDFSLDRSVVSEINGTTLTAREGGIVFGTGTGETGGPRNGLTGTASITNSSISGGLEMNLRVVNQSGTLNRLTIDVVTFGGTSTNGAIQLGSSVQIESESGAIVNVTCEDSFFTSTAATHFNRILAGFGASDTIFHRNAVSNAHTAVVGGGGGVRLFGGNNTGTNDANATFSIANDTIRDANGTPLAVNKTGGTGTFSGSITGNTIAVSGVASSGSVAGSALQVLNDGSGPYTATITGNTLRQCSNFGLLMQAGGSGVVGSGSMTLAVQSNTIAEPSPVMPGNIAKNGIHLNAGVTPGDTYQVTLTLGGAGALRNTIVGSGAGIRSACGYRNGFPSPAAPVNDGPLARLRWRLD